MLKFESIFCLESKNKITFFSFHQIYTINIALLIKNNIPISVNFKKTRYLLKQHLHNHNNNKNK